MKLAPLYKLSFNVGRTWVSQLAQPETLLQYVGTATGYCAGEIRGSFRGVNPFPQTPAPTETYRLQGMIETEEGVKLLVDYQVTWRSRLEGGYQLLGTAQHSSRSDEYGWLNGMIFAVAGEVRHAEGGQPEIVLEVDEMTWEPVETG